MVANPFQFLAVFLMVWISDCLEEVAISPRAADILGRTASDCFQEARIGDARHSIEEAFHTDRVVPAVAEIVEVCERSGADILQDIDKPGFAGIERPVTEVVVRIGDAPADVTGPNLVEVAVGPPHRGLEHQVQAIQADFQRHLNPSQDNRLNVIKFDPQSGNGGGHGATLQGS